jgi:DNA primase large subunit
MGKRVISFRIERSAVELIRTKGKNRSSVIREAINQVIKKGGITNDDLMITLSIPVDEKTKVSVKVDDETLYKLKRIAEQNNIYVSELLRVAIWKFLLEEVGHRQIKPE